MERIQVQLRMPVSITDSHPEKDLPQIDKKDESLSLALSRSLHTNNDRK